MINVTNKAQIYLASVLKSKEQFRISILGGGCGGFTYNFSIEDTAKLDKQDTILNSNPQVVIDSYSMTLMPDAEIDWEQNYLNSQFIVRDPNASMCGCGISFNPKTI